MSELNEKLNDLSEKLGRAAACLNRYEGTHGNQRIKTEVDRAEVIVLDALHDIAQILVSLNEQ